jgi:hypothetical protein
MRPPLSLLQAWKAFLRSAFHCGGGGRFRWFVRRPGRHGCPVATVGELSEGTQLLPSSVSSPTNQRARPPLGLESDGPQSPFFSVRKRISEHGPLRAPRLVRWAGISEWAASKVCSTRCICFSCQHWEKRILRPSLRALRHKPCCCLRHNKLRGSLICVAVRCL